MRAELKRLAQKRERPTTVYILVNLTGEMRTHVTDSFSLSLWLSKTKLGQLMPVMCRQRTRCLADA